MLNPAFCEAARCRLPPRPEHGFKQVAIGHLHCRGRNGQAFTPALDTLPTVSADSELVDMEARAAVIAHELRSAGGQLQALYLTGLPGAGKLTFPACNKHPSICRCVRPCNDLTRT